MKKSKFGFNHYWKPTPKFWRQVGDACLIISLAFSGTLIVNDFPVIGYIVQAIGILGKILTNATAKNFD